MGSGLSMASCAEITTKYAKAYQQASKKDKGRVLDQVVEVTGWSRDTRWCGRPRWAVREVPRGLDADPARRAGMPRRARTRQCGQEAGDLRPRGPLQPSGSCRAAGHECGVDRPVPGPGQGQGRDQGQVDHEALTAAAELDQDPQSRRRGRDRARVLRGRHDKPRTPFDRLLAANVLSPAQVG